ncbi:hypothetical protein BQ8482_110304 [Mesorhizobium delmotii]|uniref:Uncharacterized protein n=1 Tax=Mesorhizobium delmotii TaxID=1631247 RepID=A0A2P9AB69_9HYPH|nr:hypothetical protein BQ8482_110304 [Mesorhizobium delmotii]
MIGNRKERAERFFFAGASAGGLIAGSVGAFGASVTGATLALGNGRTSAVGVAFEDMGNLSWHLFGKSAILNRSVRCER